MKQVFRCKCARCPDKCKCLKCNVRLADLKKIFRTCVAYWLTKEKKAINESQIDKLFDEIVGLKNPFRLSGKFARQLVKDKRYPAAELKTIGLVQAKVAPGRHVQEHRKHLQKHQDKLREQICLYDADDWRYDEINSQIQKIEDALNTLSVPAKVNSRQADQLNDLIMRCLVHGLKHFGLEPYNDMLIKGMGQNCPHGLGTLALAIHEPNIFHSEKEYSKASFIRRWLKEWQKKRKLIKNRTFEPAESISESYYRLLDF